MPALTTFFCALLLGGESAYSSEITAVRPGEVIIEPVGTDAASEHLIAWNAHARAVSEISQDRLLRSRVVRIPEPLRVMSPGEATVAPEPTARLRLPIFPPRVVFVAENTSFRSGPWSFNWHGEIIDGGKGDVHISGIKSDESGYTLLMHIRSDRGDFHVFPTDTRPYYVVAEGNRWMIER